MTPTPVTPPAPEALPSAVEAPVEERAPNQREFGLNSPEMWDLVRPAPSMLPRFRPSWPQKVERDEG